jgi:hypothetical protein
MLPTIASAQSREDIAASLNGQHPSEYYQTAIKLFSAGQKEEAVFIFYLGQLRYRTLLKAKSFPDGDPNPVLFASLSEVVGKPINEYAFGDITGLDETLQAVLAHDAANPDTFTPPADFPAAHTEIRDGLEKMRQGLVANAEDIRAKRKEKGLENRTE